MPATFTDTESRPWAVAVNAASIKRVKDATGFNLVELFDEKSRRLVELYRDPLLVAEILAAVVAPELDTKGVSRVSFDAALTGDAIRAGLTALLESTNAFFPHVHQRTAGRLAIAKTAAVIDKLFERAASRVCRALAAGEHARDA
jgi:hypothetical protein